MSLEPAFVMSFVWINQAIGAVLVLLASWLFVSNSYANPASPRLTDLYFLELADPYGGIKGETLEVLKGRHVVFVTGVGNEIAGPLSIYFADNIKLLQEEPYRLSTDKINPPSYRSVSDNAEDLYIAFRKQRKDYKKPLIVVAHSKGGAEVLHAILTYPSLMYGIIDRVVLLQAAIGGSALADEKDRSWAMKLISYIAGPGMNSLTREQAKLSFEEVFRFFKATMKDRFDEMAQNEIEKISKRIFYVRSKTLPKDVSYPLWLIQCISRKGNCCHESDGILDPADQKLVLDSGEEFGTDLGVFYLEHNEVAVSGFWSKGSREKRMAFTRALFQQIFE